MTKLTYRLWLVALVGCAFTGAVNAQNNSKECMKVGLNLSPIVPDGNFMFKDYFKQGLINVSNDILTDNDGYPFQSGFSVLLFRADAMKNIFVKDHTLSWDGAANAPTNPVRISDTSNRWTIVPNSYKTSGTGGQCQIRLNTSKLNSEDIELRLSFRYRSTSIDPNNPLHIRNVRLIRAGFENTDYINQPFNPEFVGLIKPFSEISLRSSQMLFISDTTNNIRWKDRITPTSISQTSFNAKKTSYAYEHMIQLCNETNVNASLYFPICADEDYLFQMATLFKNNLKNKQTITLFPADFGALRASFVEKVKQHPIYKNDIELALADYTGRAWRIWRNVFGADSSRVIRGIEVPFGNSSTSTLAKIVNFHGKGNFELIHSFGSIWELDSSLLKPTLTAEEGYNSKLNSIKSSNKNKNELQKIITLAKAYNAKVSLEDLDIPAGFKTSDSTGVSFTESQIENLTKVMMDTLNNMGVSLVFIQNYRYTFEPNKLSEGGIRVAAPYFAVVNNLPTEGDCAKPSAVMEELKVQYFQVFPNPTNGEVTFTTTLNNIGNKLKVECYNSLGAAVYTGEVTVNESLNLLQNQSVGIYNIIITTPEGKKYQHKLLKY